MTGSVLRLGAVPVLMHVYVSTLGFPYLIHDVTFTLNASMYILLYNICTFCAILLVHIDYCDRS